MPAFLGKVLVALLCVVALVGCSEDDAAPSGEETSSRPSGPLTKRQFVRRGNQICTATVMRFASVTPPADADPQREAEQALRAVRKVFVPALRQQVRSLRALRPPRKLQPRTRSLLSRYHRAVEDLADDPLLIAEPTELEAVTRKLGKLGLKRCGAPM